MKIKISFLFVTVSQAIRKILLAELLEDFLLVTRLKAGQYKVFLVEHCTHAFIEGFSCVEKNLLAIVPLHSILPFHVSCNHLHVVSYNIIEELRESCHCVSYISDGVT